MTKTATMGTSSSQRTWLIELTVRRMIPDATADHGPGDPPATPPVARRGRSARRGRARRAGLRRARAGPVASITTV